MAFQWNQYSKIPKNILYW